MIRKIGVLCQDRNSFGFVLGLKRRLLCDAELIEPSTGSLSKSTMLTRQQARLATQDLCRKGVDLILRFTDADVHRWQEVRRHEEAMLSSHVGTMFVCGVAAQNIEQWLALDPAYLERQLGLAGIETALPDHRTSIVKKAIVHRRQPNQPVHEVTACLVADAPPTVFRVWLKTDEALRQFYQDCRRAALQANCDVPNELGDQ